MGHNLTEQGAVNYKGETEYVFNSRIAQMMKNLFLLDTGIDVRIFYRDGMNRKVVAELVGDYAPDCSLELHFNSFKTRAYGCEILVLKEDVDSIFAADKITDDLAESFSLRERGRYIETDGVKLLDREARGSSNLRWVKEEGVPIVMLIEPCFANIRTKESEAIFENEEKYAITLVSSLIKNVFNRIH